MMVFIDILFGPMYLVARSRELQFGRFDGTAHTEAEYKRTASPQANKSGTLDEVARGGEFPVSRYHGRSETEPGRKKSWSKLPHSKDKENEKIFRFAAREDGNNS
jgi:hypothetical protein